MDKELYDLLDGVTENELMPVQDILESIADNTGLPDEIGSDIRSSVMRKAGFEMNGTIKLKRTERNKTDKDIEHTAEVARVRHGGAIAACLAVAVVGALAAVLLFGQGIDIDEPLGQPAASSERIEVIDDGTMTAIPDVSGMDADVARAALEQAGFTPVQRDMFDDSVPAGKVVKTEPAYDENAFYEKGTEVQFFVSQGAFEAKTEVPDMIGCDMDIAIQQLEGCGLKYEIAKVKGTDGKNLVIEQSYPAGTAVDMGTMVTIWVTFDEADDNVEWDVEPIEIVVDPYNIITVSHPVEVGDLILAINKIKAIMPDYKFEYTDPDSQQGGDYPGYSLHMNGDSYEDMYFIKLVDGDLPNFSNNYTDYKIPQEYIDELVEIIEKQVRAAGLKPQS